MYREKGNHILTTAIEQQREPRRLQAARDAGLRGDLPARGAGRAGGPRRAARGDHRQDHPDLDHVRQQRDRRRSSPLPRSASWPRSAASSSTPTRPRRRARCRSTSRPWASTCCRLRPTRCTGPRAWAPLRPPQEPARAARRHDGWRRPRARHALRHAAGAAGSSGSAKAAEICREEMAEEGKRLAALRDRLQDLILSKAGRGLRQRLPAAPAAAQPEHQLRLRRGRVGADGASTRSRRCPRARPAPRRPSSRRT